MADGVVGPVSESPDSIWGEMCVGRLLVGARALALDLTADQAHSLCRHAALVYEANATVNLTRIPAENALELHILDSLSGLACMEGGPAGRWADIGSGAGYPGIPLAIVGGRHVDLLESVGKKAAFLEHVAAELRLDVTVRGCRAEEAANVPGAYSAVAARAVSSLPSLVELASPLLSEGGRLVCWKGSPELAELERGSAVARLVGMRQIGVERRFLPGPEAARTLVIYEKVGRSSLALPRRAGMAQRHPLT